MKRICKPRMLVSKSNKSYIGLQEEKNTGSEKVRVRGKDNEDFTLN